MTEFHIHSCWYTNFLLTLTLSAAIRRTSHVSAIIFYVSFYKRAFAIARAHKCSSFVCSLTFIIIIIIITYTLRQGFLITARRDSQMIYDDNPAIDLSSLGRTSYDRPRLLVSCLRFHRVLHWSSYSKSF
jgi:hypothetical protein